MMRPYNPDAMGKTFAEKALARAAGKAEVSAGQIVDARPDRVLSHDNTAAIYRLFRQLGVEKVKHPERLCITLDHAAPAPTTQHAQNHAEVRAFVRAQGVRHFFEVGRGICHQVLSEEALVLPGMTILGADSHTTHFGWLGAFGAGVGRSEVAALWATGELWLRVPESMKVVLTGQLPPWVTTKDLCLKLIGDLGQDGGLYRSVEFHGDAIRALNLESRMVIPNMMAEFGAKNAYLPPDEAVFGYLEQRLRRRRQAAQAQGDADEMRTLDAQLETLRSAALYPDPDADYVLECHYDLSALEPMVAQPHRVDNVAPVSAVRGRPVHQAWLGTCTNGRLEDIAAACEVLRGRRVARTTRLLWTPASSEVLQEALRLGYAAILLEAGGGDRHAGLRPVHGQSHGRAGHRRSHDQQRQPQLSRTHGHPRR
jgi:3-isopropylmalate/(R)-2-methylmalate dehydratase large subunit